MPGRNSTPNARPEPASRLSESRGDRSVKRSDAVLDGQVASRIGKDPLFVARPRRDLPGGKPVVDHELAQRRGRFETRDVCRSCASWLQRSARGLHGSHDVAAAREPRRHGAMNAVYRRAECPGMACCASIPRAVVHQTGTMKNLRTQHTLHILLHGSEPAIWRRIEVDGSMTLERFHEVLQGALGWTNSHLHLYMDRNPLIRGRLRTGEQPTTWLMCQQHRGRNGRRGRNPHHPDPGAGPLRRQALIRIRPRRQLVAPGHRGILPCPLDP